MTAAITGASAPSSEGTAVSEHPLVMPAGILAGDLILTISSIGSNGFLPDPAQPLGWVMMMDFSGVNIVLCVFAKIADGTETGTTPPFTTAIDATSVSTTVRITGWSGDLDGLNVSMGTTANSTAPDPASLTVSWDDTDNLWLAVCAVHRNTSVTTYPSGYIDNQSVVIAGTGGESVLVASCSQDIVALTDDPGAYAVPDGRRWAAATIGIAAATEVFTDPPIGNRLGIKIGIGI